MNREKIKAFFSNRITKIVLVLITALVLLLLVFRVFFHSPEKTVSYEVTAQEARLARILSSIDGVTNVTVMIGEENGRAVSAVIVFQGADSIITRMRVMDAASGALNLNKQNILVYPSS